MSIHRHNLLFIIAGLPIGGAEKMLVSLGNQIDRERFTIQIAALSNNNPLIKQIQPGAVKVVELPRKWRYDMQPAWQIRKIILEQQIDVIMAFDLFSYFYIWMALQGFSTKPKIYIKI